MLRAWGNLPAYPRRVLLRLAFTPLVLFALLSGVFVLLEVAPDRNFDRVGGRDEYCRRFAEYELPECVTGLNAYTEFWQRVLTLDFGESTVNNRPIGESIQKRWSSSAELIILGVLFTVAIALAPGATPAMRRAPNPGPPRGSHALCSQVRHTSWYKRNF